MRSLFVSNTGLSFEHCVRSWGPVEILQDENLRRDWRVLLEYRSLQGEEDTEKVGEPFGKNGPKDVSEKFYGHGVPLVHKRVDDSHCRSFTYRTSPLLRCPYEFTFLFSEGFPSESVRFRESPWLWSFYSTVSHEFKTQTRNSWCLRIRVPKHPLRLSTLISYKSSKNVSTSYSLSRSWKVGTVRTTNGSRKSGGTETSQFKKDGSCTKEENGT